MKSARLFKVILKYTYNLKGKEELLNENGIYFIAAKDEDDIAENPGDLANTLLFEKGILGKCTLMASEVEIKEVKVKPLYVRV